MAIAYLDVFCGISGDILLGTLIDAGVDPDDLRAGLCGLPIDDWELVVNQVQKSGLRATQVKVLAQGNDAHDHHDHDHHHDDDDEHNHDHHHDHDHSHQPHREPEANTHGRNADEIICIIEHGKLDPEVCRRSVQVVERIAEAEAWCHGVPRSEVHFHELGGLDTVIDVVGGVLGLKLLDIKRLYCSPLPITHGYVNTAHGRLPVPPPAVAKLLEGVPTYGLDVLGETVTPTGAGMAVTLATIGSYPEMKLQRVGWGAGHRDFPIPNLLRLFIGEPLGLSPDLPSDTVVLLEMNLDDMSPEYFASAMDRAFTAGAVDVWATPIQMKKNRPALMLSALAPPAKADAVVKVLLSETTSFGIRRQLLQRQCLERRHVKVLTSYGEIRVKVGSLEGEVMTAAPEYTDCLAAAKNHAITVKQVYQAAMTTYWTSQSQEC